MADNKTVIDIQIETATSAKSIAEMRKSLKGLLEAQSQVTDPKEWKRLANAINDTEGRIGDLNDSFKTLSGSGVERASSSIGLLGEGFKNFDFGKIKLGFQGIGAAMKAIPIFLIAEGVRYLIENWKELSEGNGLLAKSLQAVGTVVEWLIDKVGDAIKETSQFITDIQHKTSDTTRAIEKQINAFGDAIKDNAEKATKALSVQMSAFDRQITVAKAAGKETIEIEKAKQQAIIDTNLAIAKQEQAYIAAAIKSGQAVDKEHYERLTASLEAIKGAKVQEYVIEQEHTNKLKEEYKKRAADKKKEQDDLFAAALAESEKEEAKRTKDLQDDRDKEKKKAAEDEAIRLAAKKIDDDIRDLQIAEEKAANAEMVANWEKAEQDKMVAIDALFQHSQLITQNLQTLSDIAFSSKLAKAKKGSKEEEAIMRRQFEVNKKLQIAQTVISTITGAREAYKSLAGIPVVGVGLGIAAAAAATLAGLAAIQKINQTKFESPAAPTTDSGGGGSLNTGGGGSPTTQAPTTQVQPFTRLDEEGRNQSMPVKAYVVESEMTDSQKRVGRLEGQASFG